MTNDNDSEFIYNKIYIQYILIYKQLQTNELASIDIGLLDSYYYLPSITTTINSGNASD